MQDEDLLPTTYNPSHSTSKHMTTDHHIWN